MKIAHSHLRRRLAERRQVLTRLHNRLQHTPALIAATDVDKTRSLLREDRRLVVNAIKLAAYNSERLLALRFNHYYGRRKDTFSVFRALLQLPGDVQRLSQNHINVELQRPDSNKVATALEAAIHRASQLGRSAESRLLGDGPILSFALASSVNMNSLDTDPLTEEF